MTRTADFRALDDLLLLERADVRGSESELAQNFGSVLAQVGRRAPDGRGRGRKRKRRADLRQRPQARMIDRREEPQGLDLRIAERLLKRIYRRKARVNISQKVG